tara:strand:+ start:1702 stop:1962 length:261 start_codon:yes stop_codon:yes gene_type:complete
MNNIDREELDRVNLFIKNSRSLAQNDRVEIARELTDLKISLEKTQKTANKSLETIETYRETTVIEYILVSLFTATLILLGICWVIT